MVNVMSLVMACAIATSCNLYDAKEVTVQDAQEVWWSQEEEVLLAKVVQAESGADYCSDEMQQLVAQVVLNRVNHEMFPNTIEEVIYQPGQYATASSLDSVVPSERALENARKALSGSVECPTDVVWQANFPMSAWGTSVDVYKVIDATYSKMYFCHFGK